MRKDRQDLLKICFIHVSNIISKTKSYEEKEFYLKLASKGKYKAKELAR